MSTPLQQAQALVTDLAGIAAGVKAAQSEASAANKPLTATLKALATQVSQAQMEASALVLNFGIPYTSRHSSTSYLYTSGG
jgi:hypothetical protein